MSIASADAEAHDRLHEDDNRTCESAPPFT